MENIIETYVAGVKHGRWQEVSINVGDQCDLVWEPKNQFDSNAIRVDIAGIKIGYIPKEKTWNIHRYRGFGIKLHCEITEFDLHTQNDWQRIKVKVTAESSINDVDEVPL